MGKHVLLGMGNPLLDISTECEKDLLDKYGLKLNNAILAGPEHQALYAELVEKYKVDYIAGGATQNSIRVAQWMSSTPDFAAYIGCIGDDAFGKQLKAAAEADGVTTYYSVVNDAPTGTCAVLIHEKERSLVANLGAAEKYNRTHFESAEIQEVVKGAEIVYSAGFFLTHSAGVMVDTGKACAESNKIYCVNLSAPFLPMFFKDQMASVLPYADFVFGNESEAQAYAEANGFPTATIDEIAAKIAALPKVNAGRPRVVVITQGSERTVIARQGVEAIEHVPVPALDSNLIVDTNGAGDAFVGGFLACLAKGASLTDAANAGHWSAQHILQKSGCVFSGTPYQG